MRFEIWILIWSTIRSGVGNSNSVLLNLDLKSYSLIWTRTNNLYNYQVILTCLNYIHMQAWSRDYERPVRKLKLRTSYTTFIYTYMTFFFYKNWYLNSIFVLLSCGTYKSLDNWAHHNLWAYCCHTSRTCFLRISYAYFPENWYMVIIFYSIIPHVIFVKCSINQC